MCSTENVTNNLQRLRVVISNVRLWYIFTHHLTTREQKKRSKNRLKISENKAMDLWIITFYLEFHNQKFRPSQFYDEDIERKIY